MCRLIAQKGVPKGIARTETRGKGRGLRKTSDACFRAPFPEAGSALWKTPVPPNTAQLWYSRAHLALVALGKVGLQPW
jgi:hypothetical protein